MKTLINDTLYDSPPLLQNPVITSLDYTLEALALQRDSVEILVDETNLDPNKLLIISETANQINQVHIMKYIMLDF